MQCFFKKLGNSFYKIVSNNGKIWYLPLLWLAYLAVFAGFMPLFLEFILKDSKGLKVHFISVAAVFLIIFIAMALKVISTKIPAIINKIYNQLSFVMYILNFIKFIQILSFIQVINLINALQIVSLITYLFNLILVVSPFSIFVFSLYKELYKEFYFDFFYYVINPFRVIPFANMPMGIFLIKAMIYFLLIEFFKILWHKLLKYCAKDK